MKIAIYVDKRAATLAGCDEHGWQLVAVPAGQLTQEERQTLADWANYWGDPFEREAAQSPLKGADYALSADICVRGEHLTLPPVAQATLDTVRQRLADAVAAPGQAAAKRLAEARARIQAWVEEGGYLPTADHEHLTCGERALLETRRQQEAAERAAREQAAREERVAREQAARDQETARLLALREWAQEHGSELLRLRLEEGMAWQGLARQEWADQEIDARLAPRERAEIPEGYSAEAVDRDSPTLEEIKGLRAAREALSPLGERLCRIELIRASYSPDDHDEEDDAGYSSTELRVVYRCPDGRESSRDYSLHPA